MTGFLYSGIVVTTLLVLFWTPYLFAKGLLLLTYDKITFSDKVKCFIPIFNLFYATKAYYGHVSVTGVAAIVEVLLVGFKVFAVYNMPTNESLHELTFYAIVALLITYCVSAAVYNFMILLESRVVSLQMRILYSVIFPWGHWYIGNVLYKAISIYTKADKTFQQE